MTDKTPERYRSFLDQLGRHMRHMILEFGRSDPNDTANTFQNFVNEINAYPGLSIRSIRVRNRHLHSGRRSFSIFRGKVIRAFCTLLMEQVHVQEVDLSYCQINRYEGTRLLEALTYNFQHHAIGRLDIEGFFLPRDPVYKQTVVTNPKFSEVMGTFTALAHVCLNQVYMNEVVLEKLTTSSGSTLRTLELVTDPISFVHRPVISPSSWFAAVERCPQLKVSVRFIRPYFRQYNTVLVPNIPLSEVSIVSMWNIQEENEDEFTADMLNGDLLFDHISNVFYRTIEKVQVLVQPKPNMLLDRALVNLIEKCHRLQNIFVDVTILPETVHQIMAVVSNSARERWNMSVFVSELTRKDVDDLQMVWPAINTTICQSADQDPQYDMCKIYLTKLK